MFLLAVQLSILHERPAILQYGRRISAIDAVE